MQGQAAESQLCCTLSSAPLACVLLLHAGEKETAQQRAARLEREAEERRRAAGEKEVEAARRRSEASCGRGCIVCVCVFVRSGAVE